MQRNMAVKIPLGKVGRRAGATIVLIGYPLREYEQSVLVCDLQFNKYSTVEVTESVES